MFIFCSGKLCTCFVWDIAASIVLVKYNFRYTVFGKGIKVKKEVILKNVDIYIAVACSIDKYNWTEFIAGKTSPYHLKNISIPCLTSDVFKCILLLLCLMSKNSNLLLSRILLECTLVRPINFSPIRDAQPRSGPTDSGPPRDRWCDQ